MRQENKRKRGEEDKGLKVVFAASAVTLLDMAWEELEFAGCKTW